MSIFKRMKDMTKASIHEMLDKMEDPVVMLNQYLRDMEAEIHTAEVTVAKQMANERRMLQRLEEATRSGADRESKAESALRGGTGRAGAQAAGGENFLRPEDGGFSELHANAKAQAEELMNQLHGMKDEYLPASQQAQRAGCPCPNGESEKANGASTAVHTIESGNASRGFGRMEEKIMQMEAEADVMRVPFGAYNGPAASGTRGSIEAIESGRTASGAQEQTESSIHRIRRITRSMNR